MAHDHAVLLASIDAFSRRLDLIEDRFESIEEDVATLKLLYTDELKQYKACVSYYRKLTSILLDLPDFKEKWDKYHEAPDYDRR